VTYASPNALSVYRRLGLTTDLTGLDLAETTRSLVPAARRPDEETLGAVLGGRVPRDTEIGSDTVLILRAIPLRPEGEHLGALVLVRDVTDLRRRDRELVTKDATIREIHHRVKNNLQTVAALLRLQARRIDVPEGRAALEEAVRRVGSIAIVHETLSQAFEEAVDFDDVADRLRTMVAEVSSPGAGVRTARVGSFGMLPAEVATPMAMALTELLQNAVEHGLAGGEGTVTMTAHRLVGRLRVTVEDDGRGLPAGFDPDASASLGLSIVRTLVESELDGRLVVGSRAAGGTRVEIDVPAHA
jgi:two-component sensor histidine kinase